MESNPRPTGSRRRQPAMRPGRRSASVAVSKRGRYPRSGDDVVRPVAAAPQGDGWFSLHGCRRHRRRRVGRVRGPRAGDGPCAERAALRSPSRHRLALRDGTRALRRGGGSRPSCLLGGRVAPQVVRRPARHLLDPPVLHHGPGDGVARVGGAPSGGREDGAARSGARGTRGGGSGQSCQGRLPHHRLTRTALPADGDPGVVPDAPLRPPAACGRRPRAGYHRTEYAAASEARRGPARRLTCGRGQAGDRHAERRPVRGGPARRRIAPAARRGGAGASDRRRERRRRRAG